MYIYIHIYIHTYTYISYIYIYMYVYTYICIYTRYMHTFTSINIYIYIYTQAHAFHASSASLPPCRASAPHLYIINNMIYQMSCIRYSYDIYVIHAIYKISHKETYT